jgi:hypothetical protein
MLHMLVVLASIYTVFLFRLPVPPTPTRAAAGPFNAHPGVSKCLIASEQ